MPFELDLLTDQTALNEPLVRLVDDAEAWMLDSLQGTGREQAYGLGVFNASSTSEVRQVIAPLKIVSDRGTLPLRLDGPTRISQAGVNLLVNPEKGIVPSFQVVRAHPSLIAIGDGSGTTRQFQAANRFVLDLTAAVEELA